jgi:hypothetical protein
VRLSKYSSEIIENNFKTFIKMKKFAIIVLIGLVHFGLSVLILAITLSISTAADPVPAEPTMWFRLLVEATRVIHFPIISLSLYPRPLFPGNWIYLPMLVNSFIWAAGCYLTFRLGKKIRLKLRHGQRNN